MRRLLLLSIFFAITLVSGGSFAQSYVAGKDYVELESPVSTSDPSKIEVVEIFSYHCPHCMTFEPLLDQWVKKQPSDVFFVQIHSAWQPFMKPLQRGFYAASKLNLQTKIQMMAFSEFQQKRNQLASAEAWATFLEPFGEKREKIINTYNSFGVTTEIKRADAKIRAYKISGTPTIVIDGRYRIDASAGKDPHKKMLAIADFLINKVRLDRMKKISVTRAK